MCNKSNSENKMKKLFLAYILALVIANFAVAKLSIDIPEKMYVSVKKAPILQETKQVNKVAERNKQVITDFLDYLYSNNAYIKRKISSMVNSAIEPKENIIYTFLMIYPNSAGYDYYILTDKKLINAAVCPFLDGKDNNYFVVFNYRTHTDREFKLLTSQLEELKNYKGLISPRGGTAIQFLFFSVYQNNIPVNTFVLYGDFDNGAPNIEKVYQTCYDFTSVLQQSRVKDYFKYMLDKTKAESN